MSKKKDQITVYNERVISDPQVFGGQPIVKGTRIPVEIVLEHLAVNPDLSDLFEGYPRLTVDDVKACFDYARSLVRKEPKPNSRPETDPPHQHL